MLGSHVQICGNATHKTVARSRAATKGMQPLNTVCSGTLRSIPPTTYAHTPTGGVIVPI